jgi:hypothetical protein
MAAGPTYEPIATTTLSGTPLSVTFSSIPATYTDLVLICNFSTDNPVNNWISLNGDTSANYSNTTTWGSTTSAGSTRRLNDSFGILLDYYGSDTNIQSSVIVNIQDYSNTTTYKTIIARANYATTETAETVGIWRATPAAINSVTFKTTATRVYAIGSTFTLYGITAA